MTGREMNASIRKFAAVAFALGGGASLTGCVGAFDPAVDPGSPAAARVEALVAANRAYPRWADFPSRSEPLPAPQQIAARVGALEGASGELAAAAARIEWQTTGDAAAWAEAARARVAATPVDPVSAETAAEIEAFARRTRERGRAPPPIPRR
ncbi:hypothetical protein [Brevundimonas sp.]|uniref:hypothetical protein n=1 Tax=Brevundimonas sp. TaxID=1871086 RepID=UPI0025BC09F7|nr:hypothetical protein [Brevundimonas sp.]